MRWPEAPAKFCIMNRRKWELTVRKRFNDCWHIDIRLILPSAVLYVDDVLNVIYEKAQTNAASIIFNPWLSILWNWNSHTIVEKIHELNTCDEEAVLLLKMINASHRRKTLEIVETVLAELYPTLVNNTRVARCLI